MRNNKAIYHDKHRLVFRRVMRCTGITIICLALFLSFVPVMSPVSAAKTLGAPKTVKCSDKTYNSITVKWSKVSGAKSYNVYVCYPGKKKFKKVKTVKGASKVTYKVTGLKTKKVYKLRVRACKTKKGTGVGKNSKTLKVKTLGPETYTISASSKPLNKKMLRYGYYNEYTRMYYTIRSYMERFEKCNGGTLILKAGTYSVTNTIFIPSNVKIQLCNGAVIKKGTNTHVSGLKASNSLFHLVKPSKGQSKKVYGKYDGAKNISIIGERTAVIDMNYQSQSNCIEAGHNQNLNIKNVTFRNVSGGHFIELDAVNTANISGCTFMNIKDSKNVREAINLDTPDSVTGGFTAVWSKMDCTADMNITIQNCVFKNMPRAIGTHNYSYGHPHKNITIKNCNISQVTSYGIGMMYWQNSHITGCKIIGSYKNGNNKFDGILGYGLTGAQLRGNYIKNFRYPMLFKDYQERYKKIYNNISAADRKLMADNTGEGLGYDHVYIESNNNGKNRQIKIYIKISQNNQTTTTNPTNSNNPSSPNDSNNQVNPDDPNNQVDPTNPNNPSGTNDSSDQVDPNVPDTQVNSGDPNTQANPADSDTQVNLVDPDNPTEP